MQTPYWFAFAVHLSSAGAYPLHFWVRKIVPGNELAHRSGFGRATGITLVLGPLLLGAPEALGGARRRPHVPRARNRASSSIGHCFGERLPMLIGEIRRRALESGEVANQSDFPRARSKAFAALPHGEFVKAVQYCPQSQDMPPGRSQVLTRATGLEAPLFACAALYPPRPVRYGVTEAITRWLSRVEK